MHGVAPHLCSVVEIHQGAPTQLTSRNYVTYREYRNEEPFIFSTSWFSFILVLFKGDICDLFYFAFIFSAILENMTRVNVAWLALGVGGRVVVLEVHPNKGFKGITNTETENPENQNDVE